MRAEAVTPAEAVVLAGSIPSQFQVNSLLSDII